MQTIATFLADHALPPAAEIASVAGGCINHNYRLRCADQSRYFFKCHPSSPAGFFPAEAAGLRALAATRTLRVPTVVAVSEQGLLLEYLEATSVEGDYWRQLGEQLARLHRCTHDRFGFTQDNFCGLTPQPNPWYRDGVAFFAEQRLHYQAALACRRGVLPRTLMDAIDNLVARLPQLLPEQPPALLHGDLWSGNVLSHRGQPVLVDPAAHYGLAEAELAMTQLFGGFPTEFYASYQHVNPLPADWQQRCGIYNLYHLLNHLNLFGQGYLAAIRDLLKQYA